MGVATATALTKSTCKNCFNIGGGEEGWDEMHTPFPLFPAREPATRTNSFTKTTSLNEPAPISKQRVQFSCPSPDSLLLAASKKKKKWLSFSAPSQVTELPAHNLIVLRSLRCSFLMETTVARGESRHFCHYLSLDPLQ